MTNQTIVMQDGIELLSGAMMNYNAPETSGASIEDLATALSNNCRFAGHLPYHYSVAQHSVNVAKVVAAMLYGSDFSEASRSHLIFTGLMHDTAEAFTNDLPTPLKRHPEVAATFSKLEREIETAMSNKFGFLYPLPDVVKKADTILLGLEKDYVKGMPESHWEILDGVDYAEYLPYVNLAPMTQEMARREFMTMFSRYTPDA